MLLPSNVLRENAMAMIKKYSMLTEGETVLVAVSGGPDSVALLRFLYEIKNTFNLTICVFHLNHKIRGLEADEDESFVAELAARLGLVTHMAEYNVPALAKREKMTIEEAARHARYEMMEKAAVEIGAARIALGHHRDDQVETFLMRLLRGAGLDGLAAMRAVRDRYIRPFLSSSKEEIREYLSENAIQYRIDASNEDISIFRNRVRHELVPLLADYNPQFKNAILRTIDTINDDRSLIDGFIDKIFGEMVFLEDGIITVKTDEFLDLPLAAKRRLIRKMIEKVKGDLRGIEFKHIESIIESLISESGQFRIELPGGILVFEEYGFIMVAEKEKSQAKPFKTRIMEIPGVTIIDELGMAIKAEIMDTTNISFERDGRVAHLDAGKVKGDVFVRSRKPGDTFFPFGMKGEKKLKDFFIDSKIARRKRDLIPIVALDGNVLWVAGYRIDNRFRITSETRHVLLLEMEEL
jgi:tRNA(Ile)-lysidine synthase